MASLISTSATIEPKEGERVRKRRKIKNKTRRKFVKKKEMEEAEIQEKEEWKKEEPKELLVEAGFFSKFKKGKRVRKSRN